MLSNQLPVSEYPNFYATYINALDNAHLLEELEISLHDFIKFVQNIPLDKFDYRYEKDKWTIKDIIQHLIDSERVFAYRSLCIARDNTMELVPFDENKFVNSTGANSRSIQKLLEEMAVVRQSTLALFKSFSAKDIEAIGKISGNEMSVRAIGFIIIGHQKHHQKVFLERYL